LFRLWNTTYFCPAFNRSLPVFVFAIIFGEKRGSCVVGSLGAIPVGQCYKRPIYLSIRDFLQEFDKKHYRVKNHALTDEDLLGYRLIKAANLAPDKEQLVKATVTTLNYDVVKEKMLKIFSDDSKIPMSTDPVSV
jgi:hypothetical protein